MTACDPIGVIFDMDGVLVDSAQAHRRSWQLLAEQTGRTITDQQFASTFGQPSRQIIRQLWGPHLTDQLVAELDQRKEQIYRQLIAHRIPTMPGALDLIRRLQQAGAKLAIGSSGPPANIDLVIDSLGIRQSFSAIVTGMDVTRGKPDPEVFLLAAKRLQLPAHRCAVIEDAPAGILAAHRAGMAAVGLVGTHPPEKLASADLLVHSLDQLDPHCLRSLVDRPSTRTHSCPATGPQNRPPGA